ARRDAGTTARNERMARIPGGSFMMGADDGDQDELPVHQVTIGPFEMDLTEVTMAAYRECVRAGACAVPDATVDWLYITPEARAWYSQFCNWDKPDRERHPMNCVALRQARGYCAWAGKRLPTEEEWEYAARGRDGRHYPWGNDPPGPHLVNALHAEHAALRGKKAEAGGAPSQRGDTWAGTAPVGSFPGGRSPHGLLDMAGNVWEWTTSRYCPYGHNACDSPDLVLRGGGWNVSRPEILRATYRFRSPPAYRYDLVGFRCARTVTPANGCAPRPETGRCTGCSQRF